jgi:uncharacterized protein (DUF1697 family)
MPRYIALLRGINVGGHNVKNDQLRSIFEKIGFDNVSTFIASGNVIFESDDTNAAALEQVCEARLRKSLGYDCATFLRTSEQIAATAVYEAFDASVHNLEGAVQYVMFMKERPTRELTRQLKELCCETDQFHANGREVFWLCRTRMSDSPASARLDKMMGAGNTMRNMNTVRRLADKFCAIE